MRTRTKPALKVTRDYSIFKGHELNRPFHEDRQLEASMKVHGFAPSCAIHCTPNGDGRLKVLQGHHRLAIAKKLNLPVWYIVDDTQFDIFDLEGGKTRWTMADFAHARAKGGDKACARLLAACKRHGTPIGVTASMLAGETIGSNQGKAVRRGSFTLSDSDLANRVLRMVDACKEAGVPFACGSTFVRALAVVSLVSRFDDDHFIEQVRKHPALMVRRETHADALEEIEKVYVYATRAKRIPLKFMALNAARERSACAKKRGA